jgi:hypothetical protein
MIPPSLFKLFFTKLLLQLYPVKSDLFRDSLGPHWRRKDKAEAQVMVNSAFYGRTFSNLRCNRWRRRKINSRL